MPQKNRYVPKLPYAPKLTSVFGRTYLCEDISFSRMKHVKISIKISIYRWKFTTDFIGMLTLNHK